MVVTIDRLAGAFDSRVKCSDVFYGMSFCRFHSALSVLSSAATLGKVELCVMIGLGSYGCYNVVVSKKMH